MKHRKSSCQFAVIPTKDCPEYYKTKGQIELSRHRTIEAARKALKGRWNDYGRIVTNWADDSD